MVHLWGLRGLQEASGCWLWKRRVDMANVRQCWEVLHQVLIAMVLDLALVWPLLVSRLDLVNDIIHAIIKNFSKRREALVVQELVVGVVDEDLSGASVWTCFGEGDHSTSVALCHWIVLNVLLGPLGSDLWLSWDAELHHEAWQNSEEASFIQQACIHHVLEALRALWSPFWMHPDGELLLLALW